MVSVVPAAFCNGSYRHAAGRARSPSYLLVQCTFLLAATTLAPSVRSSVRPFARPSVRPFVLLSVLLPIRPSVRPIILCPCVCPSVPPSICQSISLSIRPSVRQSVSPFVILPVSLSVSLSVCSSFCSSIRPFIFQSARPPIGSSFTTKDDAEMTLLDGGPLSICRRRSRRLLTVETHYPTSTPAERRFQRIIPDRASTSHRRSVGRRINFQIQRSTLQFRRLCTSAPLQLIVS